MKPLVVATATDKTLPRTYSGSRQKVVAHDIGSAPDGARIAQIDANPGCQIWRRSSRLGSDGPRNPQPASRKGRQKGGGGEIGRLGGAPTPLASMKMGPRLPGLYEWRDPDSNRGHHDFQSWTGISLTRANVLQVSGFLPIIHVRARFANCVRVSSIWAPARGWVPNRNASGGAGGAFSHLASETK